MSESGHVIALHVLSTHGEPPQPRAEVRALVGAGLEGDLHGKGRAAGTGRQVLVMERQTLESAGLQAGDLRYRGTYQFLGSTLLAPMTTPIFARKALFLCF